MDVRDAATFADSLTYLLYASCLLMLMPSLCYACVFGKFAIIWEVIIGFPAYLFYIPTEFIILPLFSKCRLDDVYGNGINVDLVKGSGVRFDDCCWH